MIGFVLICIIMLLLALLCIPVAFSGRGSLAERLSGEAELTWGGGLVAAKLILINTEQSNYIIRLGGWIKQIKRSEQNPQKTTSSKDAKGSKRLSLNFIKPFLNQKVIREVLLFLNRIWYSLKLRLSLHGEYGTDDPALTGVIAALIAALCAVINGNYFNLQLNPNFEDSTLNLRGELHGRLVPAVLIWDFGSLMLKAPIRRIWWNMMTKKNQY